MPKMLLDDLIQVLRLHKSIPNLLRIHDNRGPVLALLEATGLVHPQHAGQLGRLHFVFEQPMNFSLAIRTARRPRRVRLTLISANENMTIEFWQ